MGGTRIPSIGGIGAGDPVGRAFVELTLSDKSYKQGLSKSEKSLRDFDKETTRITQNLSRNFALAGAAIGAGLGVTIAKFTEFEKALKNVQAVAGATGEEYVKLKNFALEMGSETVFSAREAGEAMFFLASAGQSVEQQMKTTASVLDLAAATQSGLAESSQVIVNNLSAFELAADQSRRVADVFAESISSSQASLQKLRTALPQTATVFNDLNQSIETNVAALSLLFDRGVRAETAATGLRNNLLTLLDATPDVTEGLSDLGLSVEELNPQMNSLVDIVTKLEKAGFDTADSVKIFGKESNALSVLVSTGSERLREFEDSLIGAAGAAEQMKDIQLDSLVGDLKLLQSAAEGAAISFGEGLAPGVRLATRELTDFISAFNALPGPVKSALSITTAATAGLLGTLGLIGLAGPKIAAGFASVSKVTKLIGTDFSILGERIAGLVSKLGTLGSAGTLVLSTLLGIPAGIAVFAAGLKLGTNQIESTQRELTTINDAFGKLNGNVSQIQDGIDEWTEKLKTLNAALDDGVINTQRLNKATGEWIDTPIAEQITFVEGRIANLNKELRIAGGDFSAVTEEVVAMEVAVTSLDTVLDAILNPAETLGGLFTTIQDKTAGSATAMDDLAFAMNSLRGPLDFLTGDPGLPALVRTVSVLEAGVGRISKAVNEVIDIFDFSDAGGGPRIETPDTTARAETKESFKELQADIAATEKADRELRKSIEDTRKLVGVDAFDAAVIARGQAAREQEIEDRFDNEEKFAALLERLSKEEEQREKDLIVRINALREKDHQDTLDSQIEELEAELDATRENEAAIDKLKADSAKREAKENQKILDDTTTANEQAAAEVLAAWERTREDIENAFAGLFSNIFRTGKADWETFLNDIKDLFSRKMGELVADQTIGRLFDKLEGKDRGGAGILSSGIDKVFGLGAATTGTTAAGVVTAGAVTTTPTQSTALGAISIGTKLGAIAAAVAPIAIPAALVAGGLALTAASIAAGESARELAQAADATIKKRGAEAGIGISLLSEEEKDALKEALKETFEEAGRPFGVGRRRRGLAFSDFGEEVVGSMDFVANRGDRFGAGGVAMRGAGRPIPLPGGITPVTVPRGDRRSGRSINDDDEIAQMAPAAPGQTVIVNVDKLADSMPIVFPDITRTTPKEIADIASSVVVPAMKTAIKRGIFNRSIES